MFEDSPYIAVIARFGAAAELLFKLASDVLNKSRGPRSELPVMLAFAIVITFLASTNPPPKKKTCYRKPMRFSLSTFIRAEIASDQESVIT